MATHLGVTEDISSDDIDFEAIRKSRHAYIEGYLVSNASGLKLLGQRRRQQRKPVQIWLLQCLIRE